MKILQGKKREQNCPARAEHISDESIKAVVVTIKEREHETLHKFHEMVAELKPVHLEFVRKAK